MVSLHSFVSRTPAALPCAPVAHSSEVGSSCVKGFPCSFFSCLAAGADFSFLSERSDTTDESLQQNKITRTTNVQTNKFYAPSSLTDNSFMLSATW